MYYVTLDDCTYTVYWQKDVWNFIACIAYEGGLFDNFTFYISCLDCDTTDIFAPWWFWVVNLPRFFLHECFTRPASQRSWLSYNASITIFLLCIKCVYVHRSHGNAFSCNMCCLSLLPCFSYVVVMFSFIWF